MNQLIKVRGPLCATREEALAQPGAIYLHVKSGGIYRLLNTGICTSEGPDEGELMALYEHLWPKQHEFFARRMSEFVQSIEIRGERRRRYEFQVNEMIREAA